MIKENCFFYIQRNESEDGIHVWNEGILSELRFADFPLGKMLLHLDKNYPWDEITSILSDAVDEEIAIIDGDCSSFSFLFEGIKSGKNFLCQSEEVSALLAELT